MTGGAQSLTDNGISTAEAGSRGAVRDRRYRHNDGAGRLALAGKDDHTRPVFLYLVADS